MTSWQGGDTCKLTEHDRVRQDDGMKDSGLIPGRTGLQR